MKKLLMLIVVVLALTSLASALAPVTVVVRDDGSNLSVKLVNSRSGVEYYSSAIGTTAENSSGYSTFVVGEDDPNWGNLSKSLSNNSSILLNIYDNGTLIEQQRIDKLVQESARSSQLPSNVRVSNNFSAGGNVSVGGDFSASGPASFESNTNFGGVITFTPKVTGSNEFTNDSDVVNVISNILIYVGGTGDHITVNADNDLNSNLPNNATYTFIHSYANQYEFQLIIRDSYGNSTYLYFGESITLIKINGKFYLQQPNNG